MRKKILILLLLGCTHFAFAQVQVDSTELIRQSINDSFKYQTGTVSIGFGKAKLNVPKGFKYLDSEQSEKVLTEIWGNPKSEYPSLGMLFPENAGPADDKTFAFNIAFQEMGYVKDDDANSIDYEELLAEMKKSMQEANEERTKNGFPTMDIVGWASKPYYDTQKHALHWAKELKFGGEPINTLNYNIRLLGRKGVLELNAIASINELPQVKQSIDQVIAAVEFETGEKYKDFNPSVDQVAAYTVGGLVAGKVLAKVGFFVLLVKFWKVIAFAFIALGSVLWRFLANKKKPEEIKTENTQVISNTETPTENTEETKS